MSRYTAFTDQTVFKNKSLNIVSNIFYDATIAEFPAKDFTSLLCVTGKTSRIAQDQDTGTIQNIAFITSDQEIFDYFFNNVKSVFNPESVIRSTKGLFFTKYGFNFELHLDTALTLSIVTQDGLYFQSIAQIPSHIL